MAGDDDRPSAKPISWADPKLAAGLDELRALPGGAEVLAELDCEYLAAAFLAANHMNAKQALEPLRRTAQWRTESGAGATRAKLLAEPLDFLDFPHTALIREHMPLHESIAAVDKRGLPYSIRCMGMADVVGLFEKLTESQMVEWHLYVWEQRIIRLADFAQRTGRLGEVTLVQDMTSPEGILAMWRRNQGKQHIMRKVTGMMDTHYPGMLGLVLLTNAPWAVHAILQVVRPLLPERISRKIEAVPALQTANRMRELVEPAVLPRFLGGDAPDEDFVPNRTSVAEESTTEVYIPAGKSEERSVWVAEHRIAAYGFSVAGDAKQDILFSCRFETEGSSVEVHAPARVKEAAGGTFVAPQNGRLVLSFDNTYSWLKPKTVHFECSQLPEEVPVSPAAGEAAAGAPEPPAQAVAEPEVAAPPAAGEAAAGAPEPPAQAAAGTEAAAAPAEDEVAAAVAGPAAEQGSTEAAAASAESAKGGTAAAETPAANPAAAAAGAESVQPAAAESAPSEQQAAGAS